MFLAVGSDMAGAIASCDRKIPLIPKHEAGCFKEFEAGYCKAQFNFVLLRICCVV